METLADAFTLGSKAAVALVGSGGKTSLLWYLAQTYRKRYTLVTTTTKIMPPATNQYDQWYTEGQSPATGVTLAAGQDTISGKLISLPPEVLDNLAPSYDMVLMECDGSRGLPLKGWSAREPVIPGFTTVTIGVLPITALGQPISESTVHRLELFLSLTGAKRGEPLTMEHLVSIVTAGLFSKARGRNILFLNQVETSLAYTEAQALAQALPPGLTVVAGSVQRQQGEIL